MKQTEGKNMNNKFDELTKSMAQSVTRRAALKKFGVGLAGMALACFGLADKARTAQRHQGYCQVRNPSLFGHGGSMVYTGMCTDPRLCVSVASADCPANGTAEGDTSANKLGCGLKAYDSSMRCSF